MTKSELISKIATSAGITKPKADKVLNEFVSAVSGAVVAGDKVALVGFGTFSVATRAQREGRNPRTGQKIKIPASIFRTKIRSEHAVRRHSEEVDASFPIVGTFSTPNPPDGN